MKISLTAVWILSATVLTSTVAFAQEHGKAGLVFAHPETVAVIWQLSDSLAVRPEFSFSTSKNDTLPSAESWSVLTGASALFYLKSWDALRVYASPRFAYGKASSTTFGVTVETRSLAGSGSIGSEYGLGQRFAVFVETGALYTGRRATSSTSGVTDSHSWGLRSVVGGIFYF